MRSRSTYWILLGLLLLAGAWFFWPSGHRPSAQRNKLAAPGMVSTRPASTAPLLFAAGKLATNTVAKSAAKTNQFAYRLSNTSKNIGQLMNDPHAILLENALIEIGSPLNFSIPKNLQSQGDPGAYIVQARGPVDNAFRATLTAAGAQVVSYIPNNAYLVRISSGGAAGLAGQPRVQSVIPYEPYYKISSALIGAAVQQQALPSDAVLTLGLFADDATATIDQIKSLGGTVVGTDRSPFGPILRVIPPKNWTVLATLPPVGIVELAHRRTMANDLARVTLGISTDTVTTTNYLNLTGSNVVVEVNDTGIDAGHPDFASTGSPGHPGSGLSRVFGSAISMVDTNGHGTHVGGIIAGNGSESYTLNANEPQGSVTNADFAGKAPAATLYSFAALDNGGFLDISDYVLQSVPATNNALISNNSWAYDDNTYNLAAASYDAAVRDALPLVTGSQPVLFVFAAGNDGGGNDGGGGGDPDTILSPGTAKDVITVGALEQLRNITNVVTDLNGNSNAIWQAATDSSSDVASYSARGNVGIGIEGTYGRFKPDVVAPGSFVVSTRSSEWDTNAYYNPTNYYDSSITDQTVDFNGINYYNFPFVVQSNTVNVSIQILPNALSPVPFPANMPIYVSLANYPDPSTPSTYDFVTTKDNVTIPPDGLANYLSSIVNNLGGFNFAVGNSTNITVNYDILAEMVTTNDFGNYYTVLAGLNNTLKPWYRYESGTSMATPAVSGTLALMQDFFTNTLHLTPSPALLKAMLINGARPTGYYNFQVNNPINFEGWGLVNLPNSIPSSLTNHSGSATNTVYFIDQSPTNALATGDSRTYKISLSSGAQAVPLRLTLAWTDPPGNPAAAIKLVNNLDLIVTNLDNPAAPVVYYGNDIAANQVFNTPENSTNASPNLDAINNVENVFLPANAGTNFTVVIYGTSVNVNAVTAQTNNAVGVYAPNVVQDFAFVISSGNGSNSNGFAITASSGAANPTNDQRITLVTTTNSPLMNQIVGASSPLLGTNTIPFPTGSPYVNGALLDIGQTNQWHFYIMTNNAVDSSGGQIDVTNAAFVTYSAQTLSIPREGVYADSDANSTRPEADIDVFVTTDSNLLALSPITISNCINGTQVGASVGGVFNGASLGSGGSEFVVDTNSTSGQVYYVGVQSQDQMAAEYDFLPEFSSIPFSQLQNGNQIVQFFPVNIPDGDAAHPGYIDTIGLAIYPMEVQRVVFTNILAQQNPGDLVVSLKHSGSPVVLMNHDSPNSPGIYTNIYDDSGLGDIPGSQPSDGPGSLKSYVNQPGEGVWVLHTADSAPGFVGSISGSLLIKPLVNLNAGGTVVSLAPLSYFYGYIDVSAGATNLTIVATNTTATGPDTFFPSQLYEKFGEQPAPPPTPLTNYDKMAFLTNSSPLAPLYPWGAISVGPSDVPPIQPGRYFVTLYNPSTLPQTYFVVANIALGQAAVVNYSASGPTNLLDDAVTYSSVFVTNTLPIATISVGLRVDHPRISDLVFHLISPDGTRYLLMENRGGTSTNGAGITVVSTNQIANVTASGSTNASTNFVFVSQSSGTLPISWNFFTVPDQMTVYDTTNNFTSANLLFDTGMVGGTGQTNLPFTTASGALTIIINQFGNTNGAGGDAWTYTAGGISTNFYYLTFTDDTNLTTTPIKFAALPLVPLLNTNISSGFSNLFYQPEQSLEPLVGTSAYGTWQLEIQDDRAGATNNAVLDSWQLQFVFANTNATPAIVPGGQGVTNTIPANSTAWYSINVPVNADFATNLLLFASAPVNVWFSTNSPPTFTNPGDVDLIPGSTTNVAVLGTNSSPAIIPGSIYYLGVQNTNSFSVNYGFRVDFHLLASTNPPPPLTNTVPIGGIMFTNGSFLLTWFAPSNDLFQVQWTTSLAPANWVSFTNIISYNTNFPASSTNAQFNFIDDGSQTGGSGSTRFYRLILLGTASSNTLTLPIQTNFTVNVSALVTVTNTATDSNVNAILTYSLLGSPTNASISTNGVITWSNAVPAGLAARFTTLVTDNGAPSAHATNTFTIFVAPVPSITNVMVTATNVVLRWNAPTNDQFQVQSATNLAPPVIWSPFAGNITSTNGLFSFTDTNLPLVLKFYRLLLLP